MNKYKREFIEFLLATEALKIFKDRKNDKILKSDRVSPWFVDISKFNTGGTSGRLAGFFADSIINSDITGKVIYGIPEKGVGLAPLVAAAMATKDHDIGWCFSRKDEKTHGEASNLGPEDRIKKIILGMIPEEGDDIIQIDDVFTAGTAKDVANKFWLDFGRNKLVLLSIAADRQEVSVSGENAIEEYQKRTGTKVVSVITAMDVLEYLKTESGTLDNKFGEEIQRLICYFRVYGTKELKKSILKLFGTTMSGMWGRTIMAPTQPKSIIPACDMSTLEEFEELVKQTCDVDGVGGYKIGFSLGLRFGLKTVIDLGKKYTNKPFIYDHQKAGTDVPVTAKDFALLCSEAGAKAVIIFPQAGPETERAWIYHALDHGLQVIVGGRMTHPAYSVSEGGFITDEGAMNMYRIAASAGINNFVVPGNKPEVILQIKKVIEDEGVSDATFLAPGFIEQGGVISEGGKAAGPRFHAIIGRGIIKAKDKKVAALEYSSQL